jgi:ATP-binding cassette subfamily F protein uup
MSNGARAAYLSQEVPHHITGRVFDVVSNDNSAEEHEVNATLMRLGLPTDAEFSELSGGMKRRVLLARALASTPDLLLLDEPTNHLDIESIAWMEEHLVRHVKTMLFVTHDRAFLQNLATRIIELDRGKLLSWNCNYVTYLERKAAAMEAEEKQSALFDKRLAEEEAWIRRGVKARTTRNEGRVRALKEMREERRARREVAGTINVETQQAARSGAVVFEAKNLSFEYSNGAPLLRDFSTAIMRGDKVGLIGANGSGKTTLLRLLLGDLPPQGGTVKQGTRLQLAVFDQMRAALDENKTVQYNVAGENDTVLINGERRHIIGYLQDFLFEPERARSPVSVLSGGERNRLLLAKLFTQPSNVLVMDEPTNDLDLETLDLLEALLVDYPGTLLLVSHDRAFLNNVVTSTIAPLGNGLWNEYVGGYDDWKRQSAAERRALSVSKTESSTRNSKSMPTFSNDSAVKSVNRPRKMSFKETRELEELPARIEALEARHAELLAQMSRPDFYKNEAGVIQTRSQFEQVEVDLAAAYARWEELEALATQVV